MKRHFPTLSLASSPASIRKRWGRHAIGTATLLCAALSAGAPALAADACTLADRPEADWQLRVPFEVIDGRIYVPVGVNGRGPFRFAVDTGASGMG
ncbi:hypothetical protein, partial [Stenotrophomonas pictorum]